MDRETAREQILEVAERLFYARGVQAVGMAEIRATAGVSLKRLYQAFPSKDALVEEYLRRHDQWRRQALADYVDAHASTPLERILAVYDWLFVWFGQPDFRGCAFTNCFGEFGASSQVVADATRDHKAAFRRYIADLVAAAGRPSWIVGPLELLAQGAMVTAAVQESTEPARQARDAARILLDSTGAPDGPAKAPAGGRAG